MKNNKGISLIVLVITIIVIIILAGSVILSLSNNNPITQATEAQLKSTADSYNSELTLAITKQYILNNSFVATSFNARVWDGVSSTTGTIKEFITSITTADAKKYEIQNSKLVYVGSIQSEKDSLTQIGIANGAALPAVYATVAINTIATANSTINGVAPSYTNPIIPKGFKAINDGTVWPTNWNTGLVIEDASGNQFVWVPVDGTAVPYAKWCITGIAYNYLIADDTLPTGVTTESTQITKYGGFYIARFEAGNATAVLVSKKLATPWYNISYTTAKTNAEAMYATAEVKSGLVTGTQWDTTMEWIKDSGKSVIDSIAWGNHSNSVAPANVVGYGTAKATGFSEFWKANNIYDLAGNTEEWTNEKYDATSVLRGGYFAWSSMSNERPAAVRVGVMPATVSATATFRVALYIL
jgi:Tfp pilus assembly protein PilE